MKEYIINEKVVAEPMTRLEYNLFRGWDLPDDENGDDKGYRVVRATGHNSWFPEKQFNIIAFEANNNFST